MRYSRMTPATPRPDDTPAFLHALDELMLAGADARRPVGNNHQIKVTPNLSFYPGTGAIFRDGDRGPLPVRGLNALIEYLGKIRGLKAVADA